MLPFVMRFISLSVLGFSFVLLTWHVGRSDPPDGRNHGEPFSAPAPGAAAEVTSLIEQLGDDSFQRRRQASVKLARMGTAVKAVLLTALKHDDAEIRLGARRLLGEILDADHEARIKAFLADTKGKKDHGLPGWDRYRRLAGEDEASRMLFAKMQRAEPALLESAAGGGDLAGESLLLRCFQLRRPGGNVKRPNPTLATIAALLFVAGDERARVSDTTLMQVYYFIKQSAFQQSLRTGTTDKQLSRKLLGGWIKRSTGVYACQQAIRLAMQWNIKEGVFAARAMFKNQGVSAYARCQAVMALGKLGGDAELQFLQSLLTDRSVCYKRVRIVNGQRINHSTQIRDLALAVLVHQTGQKHKDYGLNNVRPNTMLLFTYSTIYFADPKSRERALKKWKEWLAKNPLKVHREQSAKPNGDADPPQARGRIQFFAPGPGRLVLFAGNIKASIQKPAEELPFYVADRETGVRLTRARQLIETRQYSAAARLLDHMLTRDNGGSYQADFRRPIYQSPRAETERLIRGLPREGRIAYELLFGAQARRELVEAIDAGDAARLQAIAVRYLPTQAGQEAALLWSGHSLDIGRPDLAASILRRLRQTAGAERFEPTLSLRMATSRLQSGMPAEARAVIEELRRSRPLAEIEIGGRPFPPLRNVDAVLARLRESVVLNHNIVKSEPGSWPLHRGDVGRNAGSVGDDPWPRTRWSIATAKHPASRAAIGTLVKAYRSEHLSALPSGHALALGNVVLARTTGELLAMDIESGDVKWRAPFTDSVDVLLAAKGGAQLASSTQLVRGLDERIWADSTYGTLSSDGRYVFLVEDVGFAFGLTAERMIVRPDGSRRLDAGWPCDYNRLTAYDVSSGKFKWEIGGPRGDFQLDAAGMFFMGPPLPLAGRLYVMAEMDAKIYLLTLESISGKVVARKQLDVIDPPAPTRPGMPVNYLPTRSPRRMCGASPSYANDVLVCPTSGNSFAAVEWATQSILWSYRPMQLSKPRFMGMIRFGMAGIPPTASDPAHDDARWNDCTVTIVNQRALLTPRNSDRLFCLELRTGQLLWEVPRLDSQYVAGVQEGIVLLVGRGAVRGLNLTDGRPAWDAIKLPPGGMPSGRGYMTAGRYYLPLMTAEIAVVDIVAGRIVQRSRSQNGQIPGNLICYNNHVISQGPEAIEAYDRLDVALELAVAKLRTTPDDAKLLTQYGEVLAFAGRYTESIAQLNRALRLRPSDRTRSLLCQVALQALRRDFTAFLPAAQKLEPLFLEAGLGADYYRSLAQGLEKSGNHLKAFSAFLKIVDLGVKLRELQAVDTALSTRRDLWLQGKLADLRKAATPSDRTEMDRAVKRHLAKACSTNKPEPLEQFLDLFDSHPLANDARDELLHLVFDDASGKVRDAKRRPLRVEQLLLQIQSGSDRVRSRSATARLAKMMAAYDRPEEAAVFYRKLRGELARTVCLNGKTGQQLFDALPSGSKIRRVFGTENAWPVGVVERKVVPSLRASTKRQWRLNVESARNPLFGDLQLELTTGRSPQLVRALDRLGKERWSVDLKTTNDTKMVFSPQMVRARMDGHLMVVWQGNRFYVVDALSSDSNHAAVLWAKDITTQFPGTTNTTRFRQQIILRMGGAMVGPVFLAVNASGRPLAELGPVTGRMICYQRMRNLVAVDPYSGKTLWMRHDIPQGSQLLGDDEVVLVIPPNSTEARVLRSSDGEEIGRCETPLRRDRVTFIGRYVLTWNEKGGRQWLRLADPFKGRDLWRREFDVAAKMCRIGLNEVGVLEPGGRFVVLSLLKGKTVVDAKLERQQELQDIAVFRSRTRYVLLAKQTIPAARLPEGSRVYPLSMGGRAELVSGRLYGFDRANGKQIWSAAISQQGLDLSQPLHIPILVFGRRIYNFKPTAKRRYETKILCLDKRNGRIIYDETISQSISRLQIVPDPAQHTIEIRTSRSGTKLRFTGNPLPKASGRK